MAALIGESSQSFDEKRAKSIRTPGELYEIILTGGFCRSPKNEQTIEHVLISTTSTDDKHLLTRLCRRVISEARRLMGKWSYLESNTTDQDTFMTGIYKNRLFSCGYSQDGISLETLDLSNPRAQWEQKGVVFAEHLFGCAGVIYGDKAYIFGGNAEGMASSNVYRFSLELPCVVEHISQMPDRRFYHNVELIDDKVLILCGSATGYRSWPGSLVDSVFEYNITTNTFRTLPRLPVKLIRPATTAWRENVLIIGGQDEEYRTYRTVWMYNVMSGESKKLPAMRCKRRNFAAVVVDDILVVVGGTNSRTSELGSAECFNFRTNKWSKMASLNHGRSNHSVVVRRVSPNVGWEDMRPIAL